MAAICDVFCGHTCSCQGSRLSVGNDVEKLTAMFSSWISQKLFSRTVQTSPGVFYYMHRPILLPLLSLELKVDGQVINLESGDGNLDFPEERRCVMFEVGL